MSLRSFLGRLGRRRADTHVAPVLEFSTVILVVPAHGIDQPALRRLLHAQGAPSNGSVVVSTGKSSSLSLGTSLLPAGT